ncbi:hypothetical protein MKW92_040577 [Papaver armeniacum]|nr:hypothetical protein MKW92_040577 [Papaver armeniacum]
MLFCNRWKKNISQEASVSVEMMNNADAYMEERCPSVLHGRSNKSKTKMVCGRLVPALRFLLAIAVVNLPLHMMFLAKDWNRIDQCQALWWPFPSALATF